MRSKTWDLVGWVFGVIFIVAAFGTIIGGSIRGLIAGFLIACAGAFLIPLVQRKAAEKKPELTSRTPYVVLSLIFLVIGASIAPKPNKTTDNHAFGQSEAASNNQPTDKYKPNQKEMAALDFLLTDDVNAFAKGELSVLGDQLDLLKVSSKEVADAYEQNEVKADSSYKGKKLFVSATIDGIQSGLADEPFLTLKGSSNMFLSPQAHFKDAKEQVGKIGELRKGDQVFLVCRGGGEIGGTALFKGCQFADDYATPLQADFKANVLKLFAQGADASSDQYIQYLSLASVAMSRLIPDDSPCLSGKSKECSSQLEKIMEDKKIKDNIKLAVEELKGKGVISQSFKLK